MARVTLARETFLSNAAVTRGFLFLFLFLRLLHFVSNVFFSIVAKNKK